MKPTARLSLTAIIPLIFILAVPQTIGEEKAGKRKIGLSDKADKIGNILTFDENFRLMECPDNPEGKLKALKNEYEKYWRLFTANKDIFNKFINDGDARLVIAVEQLTLTKNPGGFVPVPQLAIFINRGNEYLVGKDIGTALKPVAKKIVALDDFYLNLLERIKEAEEKKLPEMKEELKSATRELNEILQATAPNSSTTFNNNSNPATPTAPSKGSNPIIGTNSNNSINSNNCTNSNNSTTFNVKPPTVVSERDKNLVADAKKKKKNAENALETLEKNIDYSKKVAELIGSQYELYELDPPELTPDAKGITVNVNVLTDKPDKSKDLKLDGNDKKDKDCVVNINLEAVDKNKRPGVGDININLGDNNVKSNKGIDDKNDAL